MQSGRVQLNWRSAKPIIGMVHLRPLPGAPGYAGSVTTIVEDGVAQARALEDGGVDAIMVENYGDVPFLAENLPPVTISALTLAVAEIERVTSLPIGVNALRNDAAAALSIAATTGAQLIRVNVHTGAMLTDQGWITGRAAETLRLRAALQSQIAIAADVLVKHAVAPAGLTIEDAARDTWDRGLADVLIVSGIATGSATDLEDVRRVKKVLPHAPVWIGSGVTVDNVSQLLSIADGAIIGSAFEKNGKAGAPVVVEQVRRLIDVARKTH
ncbi:MAG TPA: BtpA/SgcQ family protein [Longimicrobiales bacterium]